MRLSVAFPLLCYIVALVLAFLLLFAGHKQGFMEDYAIVRLNTSALGYNLVDNTFNFGGDDNNPDTQEDGDGGFLDDIVDGVRDTVNDVTDSVQDFLNDAGNEVAERLAQELGISEWYSIHVLTACEGNFSPNATDPDPGLNTTDCTSGSINNRINITELIDRELSVGPARLNLADIGFPSEISEHVETVNNVLKACAILYILGVAFTGAGMLLSAATLAADTSPPRKLFAFLNLLIAILAILVLLATSILVTVGGRKAVEKINEYGAEVGLVAIAGSGFMTLSWVAFALAAAAGLFYLVDAVRAIKGRGRKRTLREKSGSP